MNVKVSKTKQDLDFFNKRLDEIRMSGHERLKARAHFAQAEAIADAVFAVAQGIARLFKRLTARSAHPAAPTAPSTG
jgi:hypothetical protein